MTKARCDEIFIEFHFVQDSQRHSISINLMKMPRKNKIGISTQLMMKLDFNSSKNTYEFSCGHKTFPILYTFSIINSTILILYS